MSVLSDLKIALKEFKKLPKCKEVVVEIGWMWPPKTKTIPVVVGTLGLLKKKWLMNFSVAHVESSIYEV